MKTRYRFIHFEQDGEFWLCMNTRHKQLLGTVEFDVTWRQWTFQPTAGRPIFSASCLRDIAHFMEQLPKD